MRRASITSYLKRSGSDRKKKTIWQFEEWQNQRDIILLLCNLFYFIFFLVRRGRIRAYSQGVGNLEGENFPSELHAKISHSLCFHAFEVGMETPPILAFKLIAQRYRYIQNSLCFP